MRGSLSRQALRTRGVSRSQRWFATKYHGQNGGAVFADKLKELGVTHIFGYSGGAILPAIDGFYDDPVVSFIQNSNEQCVGHAAAGYAKATGKVGITVTTSGPGATNLVTPLQDCLADGVPMVCFTGQVALSAIGTSAFQECPAVAISAPCSKWAFQVKSLEELPAACEKAFEVALSGRPGPVLVDLPKDVMSGTFDDAKIDAAIKHPLSSGTTAPPIDKEVIAKVAKMINNAKQPVLYIGQGAVACHQLVRDLAEKGNLPVTTTVHGLGIFDEMDPRSLHMLGMHGSAYANHTIQNADVIVAIGSRFDDRTTGVIGKYAPAAKRAAEEGTGGIVHFDIEASQIGRVVTPNLSVVGDCAESLAEMIPQITFHERANWFKQISHWKSAYPFKYTKLRTGGIKVQQVLHQIQDTIAPRSSDYVFTTGVGNHQMMATQFIRWRHPRTMLTSGSLGVMGVGVPYAVGAQFACPDKTVIVVDGDGSFNMTSTELMTIVRHKLPIKIALMNDGRQQMVWIWQKLFFEKRYMATINDCNPDYVKLAEAYGMKGLRCDNSSDLAETVSEWLAHDGPCLCDFRVTPDICLPMVAPGKALDEMILDRDESEHSIRVHAAIPVGTMAPS